MRGRNVGNRPGVVGLVLLVAMLAVAIALVAFGALGGAAADEPIEVDDCTFIWQPGHYVLTEDIEVDDGAFPCIEIIADDVVFDGQGHAINATDELTPFEANTAIHVDGAQNVEVSNVTTDGWDEAVGYAVRVDDSHNVELSDILVTNNDFGIYIENTDGFHLGDSHIEGNDRSGLRLHDVTNGTVENVELIENAMGPGGIGIYVRFDSSDILFEDVVSSGNPTDATGIRIPDDATDITLSNFTVTENDGVGLHVDSEGTVLENVVVHDTDWVLTTDADGPIDVTDLDIGASTAPNTSVSFEGTAFDLRAVDAPPTNALATGIGRYVEIEPLAETTVDLAMRYEDGDLEVVDEDTLELWQHDGAWSVINESSISQKDNVVSGSLSDMSDPTIVGIFGKASPSITGVVTDVATDEPIQGASVIAFDGGTDDLVDQTETDDGGVFAFRGLEEGTYDVSVDAPDYQPAAIEGVEVEDGETAEVSAPLEPIPVNVTVIGTTAPVTEGEPLFVDVEATNTVDEAVTETVQLVDTDDTVLDDADVDLGPGETAVLNFTWTTALGDAGTHLLRVEAGPGADHVEVSVEEFVPATFDVVIDGTNSPVTEGEPLEVEVSVENVGTEAGQVTVELRDGDETVLDDADVTLEGGDTTTLTLEWVTDADDVGQHALAVVADEAVDDVLIAVQEDDLGIIFTPTSPTYDDTIVFWATDAENPHWDFGDGATAQGTAVWHSYSSIDRHTVTVTDVDGTEDSVEVLVAPPPLVWEPIDLTLLTVDREYGGTQLAGVTWEEEFTARLIGDPVVDEFIFELDGETVVDDDVDGIITQEASATFDLGQLDGDAELVVTAVTTGGGEWEMTETISVVEPPAWLEDALAADTVVDQPAGEVRTSMEYDHVLGSFGLGDLPMPDATLGATGTPVAVFTFDVHAGAGLIEGEGQFGSSVKPWVDPTIRGSVGIQGSFDADLVFTDGVMAAEAEVRDFPGPSVGLDAPVIGELVGIGSSIDFGMGVEANVDSHLELEDGTIAPGAGLTVYASIDIYCGVFVEVFGEVDGEFDFGPTVPPDHNARGEATVGGGVGVFCGMWERSATVDYTFEFGGGLDAEAVVLRVEDHDDTAGWTLADPGGQQPLAEVASASRIVEGSITPMSAGAIAEGPVRLTDRGYEDTQPAVATVGDELVVVWSSQAEDKPIEHGRDLRYRTYNVTTEEWSATANLTDDDTSDEAPSLAAGAEGLLAAWSTMSTPIDTDEVDGPVDTMPLNEIAFSIDEGDGWGNATVITETDRMQTAPSAVSVDGGWTVAWESVNVTEEGLIDPAIHYVTVDGTGAVGEVQTVADATLARLGLDDGDPTVAYATVDPTDDTPVLEGGSLTVEVVTERIEGTDRIELHRHAATNVTDLATQGGRTVWVDGAFFPALVEGTVDGVEPLELRGDVHDVSELALAGSEGEMVLAYRAQTGGEGVHDLVYRLDRGAGWIHDRAHAPVGAVNHSAVASDVTAAADGAGFVAAYAIEKLTMDAVGDVFVAEHSFRPAFNLTAETTAAAVGEDATVSYELTNTGDIATEGDVTVVVANATTVLWEGPPESLDAGEVTTGEAEVPVDVTGAFDVSVEHEEDAHEGVEEATVVAAMPSLSVAAISTELVDEETITLAAEIDNDGAARATDVTVAFADGTGPVATTTVDLVDPDDNATAEVTVTIDAIDTNVTDSVRLDPDGELPAGTVETAERAAWFVQPDLDVGSVSYYETDDGVLAEVFVANRGAGAAPATVAILDEDEELLGANTTSIARAVDAPVFVTVPVDLGTVEAGTAVTIQASTDVPDADPSTAWMTDVIGHVRAADRPLFHVTIVEVDDEVPVGEEIAVTVDVINLGEEADTQPVTFAVEDEEIANIEVSLDPGITATETFVYEVQAGEGPALDVIVDSLTGHDTRSAAVIDEELVDPTPTPPDDGITLPDPIPGFGAVLALLALGGAIVLLRRRTGRR